MYKCERCGGTFSKFKTPGQCPLCGVWASVKCGACGYIGSADVFISNRNCCPKCGKQIQISKSSANIYNDIIKRICKQCGKTISESEATCPHCGYTDWNYSIMWWVFAIPCLALAIFIPGELFDCSRLAVGAVGFLFLIFAIVDIIKFIRTPKFYKFNSSSSFQAKGSRKSVEISKVERLSSRERIFKAIMEQEWAQVVSLGNASVDPLCTVLQDAEHWTGAVRSEAAKALGKIGNDSAIAPLCNALGNKDDSIRKSVIDSLVGFGSKSVEKLIQVIQTQNNAVEDQFHNAVMHHVDVMLADRHFTEIERSAYDRISADHDRIYIPRKAAAEALGNIGAPAIESLGAVLGNNKNNEGVKKAAIDTLVTISSEKAIELIRIALKDTNTSVQQYATEALEKVDKKGDY